VLVGDAVGLDDDSSEKLRAMSEIRASLKDDIRFLKKAFPSNRGQFHILSASVDEISCRFFTNEGTASQSIVVTAAFGVSDHES
jgi:hypothetical protein